MITTIESVLRALETDIIRFNRDVRDSDQHKDSYSTGYYAGYEGGLKRAIEIISSQGERPQ
jgi:hypothetical protein